MLRKTPLPPGVLEATRDRKGRLVMLGENAMKHIERGHPELRGAELAIVRAIEEAWIRTRTPNTNREKLYARNLGPAPWLAVVVAYSGGAGRVITAYPDKRGPKKVDRI
jgi:hypothetical protein